MAQETSKSIDKEYLEEQFRNYTEQLLDHMASNEDISNLVPRSRTIAGIDLEDNISISELVEAIASALSYNQAFYNLYAVAAETGSEISLDMDPETYIITLNLKNKNGMNISTDEIDLPLESVVVDIDYDEEAGTIKLVLKNGNKTKPINVSDITKGLVTETSFNQTIDELNGRIDSIDIPSISFETENIDFSEYF